MSLNPLHSFCVFLLGSYFFCKWIDKNPRGEISVQVAQKTQPIMRETYQGEPMIHESTPQQPSPTAIAAARAFADLLVRVTGEQINEAVKERLEAHEKNKETKM